MLDPELYTKITFREKGNYLIVSLEEELTDTEFVNLKNLIVDKVLENSVDGFVIELKALDVIDSFTTRLLHDIAQFAEKKRVPLILTSIKSVVVQAMQKQGLHFAELIKLHADVPKGISRLDELQPNYSKEV